MEIAPFAVEEWMNAYETVARYNIAETCVDSVSVDGLFRLTGGNREIFLEDFCARRLSYGDIEGNPALKEGICGLYETIRPEDIVTAHGAAGANHHVFYSLLSPGESVVSVMPTYQQLYSIPESYRADVKILRLQASSGFLPDLDKLSRLACPGTKLICINNPNNPTGALMDTACLESIVQIARRVGAYLLCDEVYRHLTQEEVDCPSVADLYEKGISVSSMSKVFSMAGVRLGWIASKDEKLLRSLRSHRDYNLISCGMFDELLAAKALEGADKLLARSLKIVRENLAVLERWMGRQSRLSWVKPRAGTTALIYYEAEEDSYTLCERLLKETGALVTPGDCFGEPKSFRIGYACGREVLEKGLNALERFFKGL